MRYIPVFAAAVLMAAPVGADPSPENLAKAEAAFKEAELHYKVGEYDKALEKYREAYLLSEAAPLLFNIGQCQRKLQRYDEAIASYRAFQRDDPETAKSANVDALILEIEEQKKNVPPPPVSQPVGDPSSVQWGDTDQLYLLGGGLGLGDNFGGAFGSVVASFGTLEAQSKLYFDGNGAALELGGGLNILSGPRRDRNAKSLMNISAGLSVPLGFDVQQVFDPVTSEQSRALIFSTGASLYAANTFFFTCHFALRVEPQAGVQLLSLSGNEAAFTETGASFFGGLAIAASYAAQRDACQ